MQSGSGRHHRRDGNDQYQHGQHDYPRGDYPQPPLGPPPSSGLSGCAIAAIVGGILAVVGVFIVVLFVFVLAASTKGSRSGGGTSAGRIVVDEYENLSDGTEWTWAVPKGTYDVELTATGDGVTVGWVGTTCTDAPTEVSVFRTTCTLASDGQLVVKNPPKLFGGGSSSVKIKITQLP